LRWSATQLDIGGNRIDMLEHAGSRAATLKAKRGRIELRKFFFAKGCGFAALVRLV
jgi:hypothetical protein